MRKKMGERGFGVGHLFFCVFDTLKMVSRMQLSSSRYLSDSFFCNNLLCLRLATNTLRNLCHKNILFS